MGADLPAADNKVKQLESTVEELRSELEKKSRELEQLKENSLNKQDSSPLHDSITKQEGQKGPKEIDSSQPSESDSLAEQKEKDPSVPMSQQSDHKVLS